MSKLIESQVVDTKEMENLEGGFGDCNVNYGFVLADEDDKENVIF